MASIILVSCGTDDEVSSLLEAEDFQVMIDENPSNGQILGTINATTNLGSLTFRLVSQRIANAFELDPSTGVLSVLQGSAFDFEINPTLTGVVSVSDGAKTLEVDVTVNLNDVSGVITFSDFSTTIDENPEQGQLLGTVDASVNSGSLNFSIVQSEPSDALFINALSGELTVFDATKFDFDTDSLVEATIEVTNQEITEQVQVTIQLNDIDETIGFNIWSGPLVTFTKADFADPSLEVNQDRVSADVWITRGNDGGSIYNANTETVSDGSSPEGTEWALGISANLSQLDFTSFRLAVGGPQFAPGRDLVLHLVAEDVYLDIRFSTWTIGRENGGGFSYSRSTP